MERITEHELKHYYKQIRLLFPAFGKSERRFLKDLKDSIGTYIDDEENITMDDIKSHFGTPHEIVTEYIDDINPDDLYKRLNTSVIIKRLVAVVIVVVVLVGAVWSVLFYKGYQEAKEQSIEKEVTFIEEE